MASYHPATAIRRRWFQRPILLVVLATACDTSIQAPANQSSGSVDVSRYVTDSVLASVGSTGQFETEPAAPEPIAQITPEVARVQAVAAARAFGPGLRSYLEREHGKPIDFSALSATRVYYATSAYEQDTPADVHRAVRKLLGPYYMVVLSQGSEAAVSVAVSAYNTDITVDEKGQLQQLSVEQGQDFRLKAINPAVADGLPLSPERAVQIASTAVGQRISGPPRLQLPLSREIPQAAWWRTPLERALTIRDSNGTSRLVTEVVVSPDLRVLAADGTEIGRHQRVVDPLSGRAFDAKIRDWVPTTFVAATTSGGR